MISICLLSSAARTFSVLTWQLILGLSIDVERNYPVIPAAGVRWKIGPQWLLDAVLPTPRLPVCDDS